MDLTGFSFIGYQRGNGETVCGYGINPTTGKKLSPPTIASTTEEIKKALNIAAEAFLIYRNKSGKEKALFLRTIANNIEQTLPNLISRGFLETALSEERIRTETARTIQQLQLFATMVEEGSWVDARIETPQEKGQNDLRSMLRPLGPVAIFTASNFPLAYSVAGGDTASALAAGCPVIVRAHPAHPGLSELIAQCVTQAAQQTHMPEGIFSMLFGAGHEIGQLLVKAPQIKAVGFTGSHTGGRALMDIAASRKEPIPVYAEMGSINPVILLASALGENSSTLANSLFHSLNLAVGQLCTNPGLILIPTNGSDTFVKKLVSLVSQSDSGTMIHPDLLANYSKKITNLKAQPTVTNLAHPTTSAFGQASAAVLTTTAGEFITNKKLHLEVFGPSTLLVSYENNNELEQILHSLEGQLTASIHGSQQELENSQPLINLMETKAGRLILNGLPTGVQVCNSIVHGGPYPASSDGRTSSVGNLAIFRFTRSVCYQNFTSATLPVELQNSNPLNIKQTINGETRSK